MVWEVSVNPPFYGAAYLILRDGDRVLMIRRRNTGFEDGNYSLVAGHIDPGESGISAMIREAREEVGIALTVQDLVHAHTQHRRSSGGRAYFDLYFVADRWDGQPENREPEKCDDMRWFPRASLPPNIVPFVRDVLAIHLPTGTPYSEWGWLW